MIKIRMKLNNLPILMLVTNVTFDFFHFLHIIFSGINDEIRARVLTILESSIVSGGGRYLSIILQQFMSIATHIRPHVMFFTITINMT